MDAKLTLSRREVFGKKARTLTQDGKTLANIFGKGRNSIAAFGDTGVIEKVVSEAGKSNPITITLDDGKELLALVNEIERDYKTRQIHHVSFQVVVKGQKVTTEVPLHLVGDAPAVKLGMIVVTMVDSLEIEATPANIPSVLEISVENLQEDGDSLHVSDLSVPEGVEVKVEGDRLIAKVETPRSQVEEEDDTEGEEVDAAGVPSDHGGDAGEDEASDDKE